jgi:hypothetical protein
MTDERNDNAMPPELYDDDRLLAYALGLEDDPGLLAAAASDAELSARLEAMRADVDVVGAHVSAAIPAPDEDYTDLSGDRWSGLKEFFEPPTGAARPRRRRRWWHVVAPVAALVVLALVVGIVAINGGVNSGSSSEGGRSADGAVTATGAQDSGASGGAKSEETPYAEKSLRERFVDQLDRFAVVVLARAQQATGAVQRFAVLRIFKGAAPKVVQLVVNDEPADKGRLHLLLLDPTSAPKADSVSPLPLTETPEPENSSSAETASPQPTESPEPIPSLAAADGPGEPLAVSYTYDGEPTVIRELAAGTDPDSVSIPLP